MLYRLRDQALIPGPRRRSDGRRRIAGGAAVSLLLHSVILAALLLRLKWEKPPEELTPPAPVSMVFEGGRPQGPTSPEPSKIPGSAVTPQPQPKAAPAPTSPPHAGAPPRPAPVAPPREAATPAPQAPTQATVPPPPRETAVPEPAPSRPAEPPPPSQPVVPTPSEVTQSAPAEVTVPPPEPPKPVPAPPPAASPAPAPPKTWPPMREATRPKPSEFPAPMDFSFGGEPARPATTAMGRPLLSLTLPHRGPADPSPYSVDTDAEVGPDWRNELSEWVEDHAYYPQQAVELGQQGTTRVLVTALPNGRVTSVELEHGSGSPWLDLALEGMFRGAKLPPFPKSAGTQPVPFHFTMHYILVR